MANSFQRDAAALRDLMNRRLPQKAVELAEDIVLKSFDTEQYQGKKGQSKWAPRKRADKGRGRRALLVQSGDLKRSIRVYYDEAQRAVVIESDKAVGGGKWMLAEIHNEGLKPVPERQFMPVPGETFTVWEDAVAQWLERELDKLLS